MIRKSADPTHPRIERTMAHATGTGTLPTEGPRREHQGTLCPSSPAESDSTVIAKPSESETLVATDLRRTLITAAAGRRKSWATGNAISLNCFANSCD